MRVRVITTWLLCLAMFVAPAGFAAQVASIQSGTATSTANGTLVVNISAVDLTRSFLVFNARHNSNQPPGSTIRGEMASSTTLEFTQVNDSSNTINIQWYVVEYQSGVKVQRGTTTQSHYTKNVTLPTPIASTNRAFVLVSKSVDDGDSIYSGDDPMTARITSTSNVRFETWSSNSDHVIAWQVVEFTNAADIFVQSGSTYITSSSMTTRDVTLSTSVEPANTIVLTGYYSSDDGSDIDERLIRAELLDSTTLRFQRADDGGDDLDSIVYQVIEFKDGTTVQSGTTSFSSGTGTQTAAIASLDTSTAIALSTLQAYSGQSLGMTTYNSDDIVGTAAFTIGFNSSTQLGLQRNHTGGTSTVNWQVIDYSAVVSPPAPATPLAFYATDESSWNSAGDVTDSSGNGHHGDPLGTADTASGGKVCRAMEIASNTTDALKYGVDTGVDIDDDVGSQGSVTFWYRSNAIWNGGPERALFDASLGNKFFDARVSAAGEVNFSLEDSDDNDVNFNTTSQAYAADEWVHVAFTWDLPGSDFRIYLNGVLSTTDSTATNGTIAELDTLYVGDNRTAYHPFGTSNSADGKIDEFRMYDEVLTLAEVVADRGATHACPVGSIDHFDIDHDNSGVNCSVESVDVTAEDSTNAAVTDYVDSVTLDTGTGKGTWSLISGSGAFADATANDGLATYTYDLSDMGYAEFGLSYIEGASPINVAVFETGAPGITDDDNEGLLYFDPTGFVITQSLLPKPPPDPIDDDITTQVAADTFTMHVAAYGQPPTCEIVESYVGAKTLRAWVTYDNPSSGTLVPTVNSDDIGISEPSATSHVVTFTLGQASFTAAYPDVGSIRLSIKDAAPTPPITGTSNNFVVRPSTFTVLPIGGNPGTTSTTGPGFVAAGAPFTVSVEARNVLGALTPNYGNETPAEGLLLTANLVTPGTGRNGTADDGAVGNGTAFTVTATPGEFSGTTFYWDEVGTITLQASVADASYLGAGDVTGTVSTDVGRFYPATFDLTSATVTPACTGFTYEGHGALAVNYTLEARNVQGTVTQNYDEDLLTAGGTGNLTWHAENADDGIDIGSRLAGWLDQWRLGTYTVNTTSASFSRGASADGPFESVQPGLSLSGVLDSQTITGRDMNPITTGDCVAAANCSAKAVGNPSAFRYGRARLANAFGPETAPLDMKLLAEYFDGTNFVTNTADTCTSYINTAFALSNYTGGLPAVTVTSPGVLTWLTAGTTTPATAPTLSAPGAGNTGSVDVTFSAPAWLQFNWSGTGDEDPTGTATFGRYRGHDRVVYWREITD